MPESQKRKAPFPFRSGGTLSVRWGLFWAFTFLVVMISGTTLAVSFIGTSQIVRSTSVPLIDKTQRLTESELQQLFAPLIREVSISRSWVQTGLVKRYDANELMRLFLPWTGTTFSVQFHDDFRYQRIRILHFSEQAGRAT